MVGVTTPGFVGAYNNAMQQTFGLPSILATSIGGLRRAGGKVFKRFLKASTAEFADPSSPKRVRRIVRRGQELA